MSRFDTTYSVEYIPGNKTKTFSAVTSERYWPGFKENKSHPPFLPYRKSRFSGKQNLMQT